MNCNEARPLVQAYHDAELDLNQALEIEQHLETCAGCRGAPVSIANRAGPAGNRVGSPKKFTCTPDRVRSRSAIRQTNLLSRNRSASISMGGRCPPVNGNTSKPRLSRYAMNRS